MRVELPDSRSLRVRTFAFVTSDNLQPNTNVPRRAEGQSTKGAKEKTAQDGGQRHSEENGGMAWLQTGGDMLSGAVSEERRVQRSQARSPMTDLGQKERRSSICRQPEAEARECENGGQVEAYVRVGSFTNETTMRRERQTADRARRFIRGKRKDGA